MIEWILTILGYVVGGLLLFTPVFLFVLVLINKIFFKNNEHKSYNKKYSIKHKYKPINNMNKTTEKLIKMKNKWKKLNIESYFPNAHHFASKKFDSKAPTLCKHYDYCIGKNIQGENIQTLERCIKVTKLYGNGLDIDEAIEQSWLEYPVLKP